jgi:DNA-binding MarR family transcriptional regulator
MRAAKDFKPTLDEEARAAARTLRLAIEPFIALKPGMPMSYFRTFLLVAEEEGLGVNDYAGKVESSPTVMTRNLLDIGDRNRLREEGLGLITQERDLFDLRRHNAKVTPKGKALMHKMITALKTFAKKEHA